MPIDEDVSAPPQTTRDRFAAIVRRKLQERGYSGDVLERKFQHIMARIEWSKVEQPV